MTTPDALAAIYPRAEWVDGRASTIVDDFHRLWYDTDRMASVTWFGHECWKYPTDMVIYAEIIHTLRPALIVETGTYRGGSALYFAHLLELLGDGRVVTIDIHDDDDIGPDPRGQCRPKHSRLTYIKGSSTDMGIVARATADIDPDAGAVLVILDSDHTADHVYAELNTWAPFATVLIVEDTNLGHEVLPAWGPGPREAVDKWLPEHPEWECDPAMERLLLTCAPGGFLRRR